MLRSTKITVAGATGRVGRQVVDILQSRGYDIVPISRSQGVDMITGEGLDQALTGVESIIDVATGPSPDQQAASGRHGALLIVGVIELIKLAGAFGNLHITREAKYSLGAS
jgi:nucleoside-diphosphate-sugar epimerase